MTNLEAALEALKVGIIVKRYPNEDGYNIFYGDELYLLYYEYKYQLCIRTRAGGLDVNDYKSTWALRLPAALECEEDSDFDKLFNKETN